MKNNQDNIHDKEQPYWEDENENFCFEQGQIERKLLELEEAYKNLINAEYGFMNIINDHRRQLDAFYQNDSLGEAYSEITSHDYIKIIVNKLPEKLDMTWKKSNYNYQSKVKKFWQNSILNALKNKPKEIYDLKKSIIYFKIINNFNGEWDVDNYNIKYIIDSIKYAGFIINDTWENVSYYVEGEQDEGLDRTEIHVIPREKFLKIFEELNK